MKDLVFRDVEGQQGSITGETAVDYQGRWEGEIEECLERITADCASGETYDHIVIELPERAPVDCVERTDIDGRDEERLVLQHR